MHNPDLAYIHQNWAPLKTAMTPGTPRPARTLDPWMTQETPGPGYTKAPLIIDALDLLLDIQGDTHAWLAQAGNTTPGRMPTPLVTLDETLRIANRRGGQWCDEVTAWAKATAQRVRTRLEGDLTGQTIKAPCPICAATGTLRIRSIKAGGLNEPYLTCESGYCRPPEGYCANFLGELPVWPMSEWEWFAGLLEAQEEVLKKRGEEA